MAERICSMPGCGKKHHGRGLCDSHLAKARREGTLPPVQADYRSSIRHSLTDVDREAKTANCAVCGPETVIRLRDDKRRPVECTGRRASRQRYAKYGVDEQRFDEMLTRQDGRCAICGEAMPKPNVDHCHETGKVRDLLCQPCNWGLGHFQDRVDLMLSAVSYLRRHAAESDAAHG